MILEPASESNNINSKISAGGSSGMTALNDHEFLAVYDLKGFEEGTRISLISCFQDSFKVEGIEISDWKDTEGRSSDLEAICSIPNKKNEFLIAESGNWQGKFGRVFHIKLSNDKRSADVLGHFKLPLNHLNDINKVGDQNEGMFCIIDKDSNFILYLGERGGSSAFPQGKITWCTLNFDDYSLHYSTVGQIGISVEAPGQWFDVRTKRDITDLYLDKNNILWAGASQDQGDAGPFYSVIYQIGYFQLDEKENLHFVKKIKLEKEIPGFKVEALSAPVDFSTSSKFSIGTEDEFYGGVWRSVY